MAFTDELAPALEPIWEAINTHPMVEGIGDGTLDHSPFRYWVIQDYLYLIEYARVFALGTAKATSLAHMSTFASLLEETINTEMDLHRQYAAEFGIDEDALESASPSPTTQAYTDFLVRTASLGTFGETLAAVLPCMWGFNQTGEVLAERGIPDHDQYAAWIEMYSSDEFGQLTDWCLSLVNEEAGSASVRDRERFRELILTSARYEYLFWDAAWREEEWPV